MTRNRKIKASKLSRKDLKEDRELHDDRKVRRVIMDKIEQLDKKDIYSFDENE